MQVVLHLIVLVALRLGGATTTIVKTFSDDEGEVKFNHMVINKDTGLVFVGAVNRLYQLSPDLELVISDVTGPHEDSPKCSVIDCPDNVVKEKTDNVNKALVIDYATSRLISCGSLFQGMCSVRNLLNISDSAVPVKEAVVANNPTASTVAFIAPGPPNPPVTQVMYVGVTYTGNSLYRSEVPAVSSLSLDKDQMFRIASSAITTATRMFVHSLVRERYPIHYIYGFASDGFSYFLTTQMKHIHQSPFISKLVRVCWDDSEYYSYTEIPIECISEGGKAYNLVQAGFVGKPGSDLAADLGITPQDDVLFAVFSESEQTEGEGSSKPSQHSALCVYSLKAIRRKFIQNIETCFSGIGNRGLDFVTPSHGCIRTKIPHIKEDFCGLDVNTPLGGEIPMVAVLVLVYNHHLTAIAATSTGNYTVVFVGTSNGHLKKIVVESSTVALEYGDVLVVENSPVNQDLRFDNQLMHLYVMTEKKVSKVKVQECNVFNSCLDCLGAKDPYCGWCSAENKCSLRSDCQDAAEDVLYWISNKSGRCTTVTPNQIQLTTPRTLKLVIDNLPTLTGQLECAFTALEKCLTTNATRKPYGVDCTTPRTNLLPSIPPGQHHFKAKLSLRMTNGPDFMATMITFFDCNTYSSCAHCVSSSFSCDWCVDSHRCTHDITKSCRNDIFVNGVRRMGPSCKSGPGFCPTTNATTGGSTDILVPSNLKNGLRVKVHIIGQSIVQTRFVCQFIVAGRVTSVNANLLGDTIYCESPEFSNTYKTPNTTATLAVIWGGSQPLDTPDNMHGPPVEYCRLPEQPDNGNYVSRCQPGDQSAACLNIPGTAVSMHWVLKYSCENNYTLSSEYPYSFCDNDTWVPSLRCIKLCPPLISLSVDIQCNIRGREVPCDSPMRPNTTATASCKDHYNQDQPPQDFLCQEYGEWSHKLHRCTPLCGRPTPPGSLQPLILNGIETKRGEFPWLAALYYQNESLLWEQRCGGTLITPHVILTAAHCVILNNGPLLAVEVKVGLGKYFRDFYKHENDSLIVDVREIATPRHYVGPVDKFTLDIALLDLVHSVEVNSFVMPACVDWTFNYIQPISSQTVGHVAGWGRTDQQNSAPSEKIMATQLTFISNVECKKIFPRDFTSIVHDKFCAGCINGSQVLKGDSGGGFTVVKNRQHFVMGVVSAKATTGIAFSLFTDIKNMEHRAWLVEKKNYFHTLHYNET